MFISLREKIKTAFYGNAVVWPLLLRAKSVWYAWHYGYYYKSKLGANQVSLRELNIEWNSSCNLRCQFCALDFEKQRQYMPVALLEKIFIQLTEDPRLANIQQINLYNGGETLLHPKRMDMFKTIARFKNAAKQANKPFPKILMLTNGMLLRPQLALEILETDALDVIQFSLDGGTPESFETLRVNAKWPVFYENIRALHKLKTDLSIDIKLKSITIVEEPNALNISWMHPEFKEIIGMMNHFELRRLHDWGGEIDLGNSATTDKKAYQPKGCMLLMHQMVLLPNGDVTVCCNDLNSKGVVGSLNQSSIFDVYAAAPRRNYLEKLGAGKKEELDLCRNCEVF